MQLSSLSHHQHEVYYEFSSFFFLFLFFLLPFSLLCPRTGFPFFFLSLSSYSYLFFVVSIELVCDTLLHLESPIKLCLAQKHSLARSLVRSLVGPVLLARFVWCRSVA